MPVVSDTPRSKSNLPRGGKLSSAPRSAGSSGSGRKTTSAPRGLTDLASLAKGQATKAQIDAAGRKNVGPGPAFTPIRAVLDAASSPAYTVGDLILGKTKSALTRSVLSSIKDKPQNKVLPGEALAQRGVLPKDGGFTGAVARLAADVALDPTTYVSFGGSAATRAATTAGSRVLEEAAAQAARTGTRVPLSTVAAAHATSEAARASAPKAVSVFFRVPFTRGKEITLAQSPDLAKVGEKLASTVGGKRAGEVLREVFLPAGAGDKALHRIGRATMRAGDAEKRIISKQAVAFQKEADRVARASGMKLDDAYQAIVKHLDNPSRYPLPDALSSLKDDAANMLDEFRKLEDSSGVDRGLIEDYVPHIAADHKTQRQLDKLFPADPGRPQFFQRPRELDNLDAWEQAGLKPEYNLARLIEVRGHASVDARVMKAFDDAVKPFEAATADIQRVKEMIRPSMTGSAAVREANRFLGAIGSSWKSLALLSPGYHLRNLQSDALAAYWAGARNPHSFVQAYKALRGKGGTIKIAGKTYTADEFVQLAEASGAIRLGQAGKEIRGELADAGGVKNIARRGKAARPGHGKLARGSQAIGDWREDIMRLGTFIERLKAGDDVMTAAQKTRDFLFDYGDVGKFVREARRFWLPFVTYPTKAATLIGRQLSQRPGSLSHVNALTREMNTAGGSPDLSLLPPGSRSATAVPAPPWLRAAIGAPQGQPILFNPESVTAYGSLNATDPTNPVRSVMGMLNPIPKALIEGKSGYNFYFDSPASKKVRAPAVINFAHKLGVPIPGYGMKRVSYPAGSPSVPAYSRNLDLFLRLFPPFGQAAPLIPGGGSDTTKLPYLKYGVGLSISPFDQAQAAYYATKYGRK